MNSNWQVRLLCDSVEECRTAVEILNGALFGTEVSILWTAKPKTGRDGDGIAYGVVVQE